jgi:hypothetical protein
MRVYAHPHARACSSICACVPARRQSVALNSQSVQSANGQRGGVGVGAGSGGGGSGVGGEPWGSASESGGRELDLLLQNGGRIPEVAAAMDK